MKIICIVLVGFLSCAGVHAQELKTLSEDGKILFRNEVQIFSDFTDDMCRIIALSEEVFSNFNPEQLLTSKAQTGMTSASIEVEMVFVKGGTFTMGCTPEQGRDCSIAEKPAHQVTLSDYYIGKYEVTQAQWQAVMGTNPSKFKGDNLPVENVSWNDIQKFLTKLNEITGKQYRLPTEAEWEYAARGGISSKGFKYSGSNIVDDVAWYIKNSNNTTHPVGIKNANELGIYDMSGNVSEWCSDRFEKYSNSDQTDPQGSSSGSNRVHRGFNWGSYSNMMRVSFRINGGVQPVFKGKSLGFRLASGSE